MKRINLLFVLACSLANSLFSFSNDIVGSIDNGRISWVFHEEDSSLIVTGVGEMRTMDLDGGHKVYLDGDSIAIGFFSGFGSFASRVKKVTIGEGINYIGIFAFNDFYNLKEVELPNTLKLLDFKSFMGPCHISKFHMPKNVKFLGGTTLGTQGSFVGHMIIDTLYWDVKELACSLDFLEFDSVWNVVFGDEVVAIPQGFCDFNNCLEKVEIPGNVKILGSCAFSHCPNLKEVVLHEGLEEMGFIALNECSLITELKLPKSLINLDNELKGISITELSIPENVKSIYSFQCSTLKRVYYNAKNASTNGLFRLLNDSLELYLGDSVEVLDDYCFQGKIKNRIDIPNSVNYIGQSAFMGMKIGTMPEYINYVGRLAFYAADLGDSLNLPKIGIIDNAAFSFIPNLKQLVINEVDSIKDGAFMSCPLEYVEVTSPTPAYIGSLPFYQTPITEIIVPKCECIEAYEDVWATAKDTYVNNVSFVSKVSCDENAIDNAISKESDSRTSKSLRKGSLVISMPDGREVDVLGRKVNY